jgi:hypothetical protein
LGIAWEVKKPTDTEITKCFVAKSLFHRNLKQFKHVSGYPDMQKWLENNDDAPSSLKAWGIHQDSYTYANFDEWISNGGTLDVSGKKKGKGKEKEKQMCRRRMREDHPRLKSTRKIRICKHILCSSMEYITNHHIL